MSALGTNVSPGGSVPPSHRPRQGARATPAVGAAGSLTSAASSGAEYGTPTLAFRGTLCRDDPERRIDRERELALGVLRHGAPRGPPLARPDVVDLEPEASLARLCGVPLISPLDDIDSPAGSAPLTTLNTNSGSQPPRATTWSEYGVPMLPPGQTKSGCPLSIVTGHGAASSNASALAVAATTPAPTTTSTAASARRTERVLRRPTGGRG